MNPSDLFPFLLTVNCNSLLDICIVIDGSDSISYPDFEILKEYVSNLADKLNIGEGNGRMGIVVYSRDIAMEEGLSYNRGYLRGKALGMPHPRDGTNTALGISTMIKIFKVSHVQMTKILFGYCSISDDLSCSSLFNVSLSTTLQLFSSC